MNSIRNFRRNYNSYLFIFKKTHVFVKSKQSWVLKIYCIFIALNTYLSLKTSKSIINIFSISDFLAIVMAQISYFFHPLNMGSHNVK